MLRKKLKKSILDNYSVEIIEDGNRLWIPLYEDQTRNILIEKWDDEKIYVNSGNNGYCCDCDDAVLYCLMEFIGDKHKWGYFKNSN